MATTYRLEFPDRLGVNWKVDFLIDGGGAVTDMTGTGDPVNIEYLSSSEELFDSPIKGSTANISVYSMVIFQWIGLYAEGDLDTKVNIYYDNSGDVLFWSGYIISGAYSEPYDGVAYPVTVNAGDGLGYLKKIQFDDAGAFYTGRQTDAWIVWTILSKINATSFSEYINLYEETMNSDTTDSPLDQVETDVSVFDGDDCYDVLEEVLRKYNACIRQVNGVFVIYRPLELYNATTSGRTYTSATVKGAAAAITPNVLFSRAAAITDLRQVNGGDLSIQPGAENMDIIQDFGNKESWIETHEFRVDDYDYGGSAFANWTSSGGCLQEPLETKCPGSGDGVLINSHNTYPASTKYIYQVFGADVETAAGDETWFSIDWQWINQCGTERPDLVFWIQVIDNGSNWYLKQNDDVSAVWNAGAAAITFTETAPVGNSGWTTYSRPITGGVPVAGPYIVKIIAPSDANPTVYLAIKNVKFYTTSNEVRAYRKTILISINDNPIFIKRGHTLSETTEVKEVVETTTSYTPGVKGIDVEYVYKLGDVDPVVTNVTNSIEQFAGCLTTGGVATTAWSTRIPDSEADELLVLIGKELEIQYARTRQVLSVPVYETGVIVSEFPAIKLLGSFQDSLNQYDAVNRRFVFNSGRFDIRNRYWDLDLVEIISTIP